MAKSRLHELSEQGVSVWIDSLSREMLETGELARLMKEDAVVGVTSNPTIFQKALATGDWYDEQLARGAQDRGRPDRDLPPARDGGHPRRLRPDAPGLGRRQRRRTATSRSRSTRRSPTTARRRSSRRCGFTREVDRPNLFVKIPATKPGLGAIEDCIAQGQVDQRHADLLARALRARSPRRTSAGSSGSSRPAAIRRRSPRSRASSSRASTPRPTGAWRRSAARRRELAGQARDRERQARVPALAGDVLRPALGVPRRQGRDDAALPLGVHLDEEPRVPRRDVRRGADRARDREHDAGRDDRRVPGPRRGRRRTRSPKGVAEAREAARAARRGGRRLRRRRRDARGRGRAEVRRLVRASCWTGSAPSAASSQRA